MNNNEMIQRLDLAYKQYKQILRPYLAQLADQNLLDCCNSWLQRLSSCADEEKKVRNQYLLTMCCQLSKGMLSEPFNKLAPIDSLENLSNEINSDETTDTECDMKSEKHCANLYEKDYCCKSSHTCTSDDLQNQQTNNIISKNENFENYEANTDNANTIDKICGVFSDPENYLIDDTNKTLFDCRATNLIMKLRDIKQENAKLHHEVTALKYEISNQSGENLRETSFVDNSNDECLCKDYSSTTVRSLKCKLSEMSESRNKLIETIGLLREKLDHYEEMKKHEIDDIRATHKLDIINLKTVLREECNCQYRNTIEALKIQYENQIQELSNNALHDELKLKENEVEEMHSILKEKDIELIRLKKELELHKEQLKSMMETYLEKQSFANEICNNDNKKRTEFLEKHISKLEKSKTKKAKLYESRLAYLQREKHLSDTTYQLQLIRQKAQITCEMVDENQVEVNAAIDKLELKYKEIVANVQATAIQRRIQDQNTLDAMLHTMKELKNVPDLTEKRGGVFLPQKAHRMREPSRDEHSCFCQGDKHVNIVSNSNLQEDSFIGGFCLDSERMGQLFNTFNIPQKDTNETPK